MELDKSKKTPTTKEFLSLEKKPKTDNVKKYKHLDSILTDKFSDMYFSEVKNPIK